MPKRPLVWLQLSPSKNKIYTQDEIIVALCELICEVLGCVRLTVFRNKNTWSDDSKRYVWRF